jgi:hypothetical protein
VARTATIESGADQRRREREEARARDLLTNLERQAREILGLAASAEFDDTVRNFAHYRAFRMKVGEFEAFCNVIETHLRRLAEEPRGVLNELLHTRRDMILGPSIKAMTAFYTRLAEDGALPFGLRDMLDEELQAVAGMREALDAAGTPMSDADDIRAAIEKIEANIRTLETRATQYDDFDLPGTIEALLPPEDVPTEPEDEAAAAEGDEATKQKRRDTPELRAVREIRTILQPKRADYALGQHVEIDLRALDDIEKRLTKDPNDTGAAKWLRHVCKSWSSRMRGKEYVFARISEEIR